VVDALLVTVLQRQGHSGNDLRDSSFVNEFLLTLYKGIEIAFWVEVHVQMENEPFWIESHVLIPDDISKPFESTQRCDFVAYEVKTAGVGYWDYIAGEILR
jgi:hypothetical protein